MKLHYQFLNRNANKSIIFLHGILGNHKNLSSIANYKSIKTDYNSYLVDLRNHGESFHTQRNRIADHAEDIIRFMDDHSLSNAHLIGHSFGAKVAIEVALKHQKRIDSLVMLDMGPYIYPRDEHLNNLTFKYITKLERINMRVSSKDMEQQLINIADGDKVLAGFFMTNLSHHPSDGFIWKSNLHAIHRDFGEVYSHKYPETKFPKKALEIAGKHSDFVDPKNLGIFQQFFPKMDLNKQVIFLDAGHWVHYQKPVEVGDHIVEFLAGPSN